MDKSLLSLLCDPKDKSPLVLNGDTLTGNIQSYDVIGGIPVLLEDGLDKMGRKILETGSNKTGFSWAEKHWFDLSLNKLFEKPENGAKLLCFGSGSPLEKKYLNDIGYEVISMDINPKYKGVDVICDGHYLPFKDNSMDAVVSFEVFEHLHSPWLAIKEVSRVLKPGGLFIGSVAFMKEFHHSFFHISHWGMLRLFEYGGLSCLKIYGGQNIFGRVISQIVPLGPRRFSEKIYNFIGNSVFAGRSWLWSLKNKMSSKTELSKFDGIPFAFSDYDRIVYSPAIIFKAFKP